MRVFEAEGLVTNDERVAWLKRLSKGTGIRREPEDFPFDLFHVGNWPELVELLGRAKDQMPHWRSTEAIFNALGFLSAQVFYISGYESDPNLLVDRRQFFANMNKLSLRTVMRLEESGALILDDYIRRINEVQTPILIKTQLAKARVELWRSLKAAGRGDVASMLMSFDRAYKDLNKNGKKALVSAVDEVIDATSRATRMAKSTDG